ncbi:MAG: hypothetical protein PVS2B2_11660 [Candidatus Acidiferrum sp.]
MGTLKKMILHSCKQELLWFVALAGILLSASQVLLGQDATQASPVNVAAHPAGTIHSINENTIILKTDAGTEVTILVQTGARIVSVAPGQKDLQGATVIQMHDLRTGDRILVRGRAGSGGKSILANAVIAMKKADIADKQRHDREDWQKNGIGGLVRSVDIATGNLTIGVVSPSGPKDVAIHVSKSTIVRRYAPDSVQFDKATLSSLEQVKPGDQLRARGSRTADENEFSVSEIVSGSFRNIAATVSSVDAANDSLSVEDLATKQIVQIKITAESEIRKLPPSLAQSIALRLKGISPEDGSTGLSSRPSVSPPNHPVGREASGNAVAGPAPPGRNGGTPDLQQMILRLPASTLTDFQKGDAVMVVATQGNAESQVTAITLLGGVEPILATSPKGEAGSLLSPWNLSDGGGDGATP